MNIYPIAKVVTSESLEVPIDTPFKRSDEADSLMLFAISLNPLAFTFSMSAT